MAYPETRNEPSPYAVADLVDSGSGHAHKDEAGVG